MTAEDARVTVACAELRRDWAMVRHHAARAISVDPGAGTAQAALVGLSLDHVYQAFESLLVRTERLLGLAERTGSEWHRTILGDAVLELPGVRPHVQALIAALAREP